jgi:hypothetical protein
MGASRNFEARFNFCADNRLVVTIPPGVPKTLCDKLYCARGPAENLIKAYKLHLASTAPRAASQLPTSSVG